MRKYDPSDSHRKALNNSDAERERRLKVRRETLARISGNEALPSILILDISSSGGGRR